MNAEQKLKALAIPKSQQHFVTAGRKNECSSEGMWVVLPLLLVVVAVWN